MSLSSDDESCTQTHRGQSRCRSDTATQRHSDTATQRHSDTATNTASYPRQLAVPRPKRLVPKAHRLRQRRPLRYPALDHLQQLAHCSHRLTNRREHTAHSGRVHTSRQRCGRSVSHRATCRLVLTGEQLSSDAAVNGRFFTLSFSANTNWTRSAQVCGEEWAARRPGHRGKHTTRCEPTATGNQRPNMRQQYAVTKWTASTRGVVGTAWAPRSRQCRPEPAWFEPGLTGGTRSSATYRRRQKSLLVRFRK